MPLSNAVIKSALARHAKQKKERMNQGGLTAKNKAMATPERRTGLNNKVPSNIIKGRMGGKVVTPTQGNAPRQNTSFKPTPKRAASSNPSGSIRTAPTTSSGVNFIINKKKKAKKAQSNSPRLPNYRS